MHVLGEGGILEADSIKSRAESMGECKLKTVTEMRWGSVHDRN